MKKRIQLVSKLNILKLAWCKKAEMMGCKRQKWALHLPYTTSFCLFLLDMYK